MTSRAVVLANLASSNILEVDSTTDRVGIGSTQPTTRLDVSGNIKAVHGNFTGVVTATSGTFNGPVTIGGTLTYEDVTNIDVVGIITARSDVSIADKIIHTGDTNTAIRFPAADTFAVETAGSERLRVTSTGDLDFKSADGVGINFRESGYINIDSDNDDSSRNFTFYDAKGTGSEKHLMILTDTGNVGIATNNTTYANSNANDLVIGSSSSSTERGITLGSSVASAIRFADAGNASAGMIQYVHNAGGTDYMNFYTSATERVRIDSSGRLLVGTTGSSKNATIVAQGNSDNSASSAEFYLQRGQATPADGATFGTIIFGDSGGGQGAAILSQRDGGTWSGSSKPGRLIFGTTVDGGTAINERLQIDSNGLIATNGRAPSSYGSANLLISGDNSTLTIMGDGSTNNSSIAAIKFRVAGATAGDYTKAGIFAKRISGYNDLAMIFAMDSAADANGVNLGDERMRIDSSGNVLIGTTSYNSTVKGVQFNQSGQAFIIAQDNPALQVNRLGGDGTVVSIRNDSTQVGTITVSGSATAYNTSSDYRLKENVVNIADGITRVKQLQPKRFNFISDNTTRVDGFLAHEAQSVVPESVTGEKDGEEMQSMDQSKLVPLLTAALQEAVAKIEVLESKVAALESS